MISTVESPLHVCGESTHKVLKLRKVPRFFYWTFQETGLVERVDSVANVPLRIIADYAPELPEYAATACGADATTGKHGNALRFAKGLSNRYNTGSSLDSAAGLVPPSITQAIQLRQDGIGFSFAFWLKVDALGTKPARIYYDSTNIIPFVVQLILCSDGCELYTLAYTGGVETISIPDPPIGEWVFVEMFFDMSLGKLGIAFNNDPLTTYMTAGGKRVYLTLEGRPAVFVESDTFHFTGDATDIGDFSIDEMILRTDYRLTAEQRSYLYNGGAGRTWPINLP